MRKCSQCGGRLKRVHRTFFERVQYMAIYECRDCKREDYVARRFMLHFGPESRCPRCGTARVIKLKERDKIDPINRGFFNWIEWLVGGKIHHCRYCRIQFYDRRPLASELASEAAVKAESQPKPECPAAPQVTTPPDTANSGA
jgi:DNA-directed RNA polymerase subunit RPC12/RpoP